MKRGASVHRDPTLAVREFAEQVALPNPAVVIFFCSSEYDAGVISREMSQHFRCPFLGCSSAGELGSRYQKHGIVGVSFSTDELMVASHFISPLTAYSAEQANSIVSLLRSELSIEDSTEGCFAFCLIDGLSSLEESFASDTYGALRGIPLVGGSAGDNLLFKETTIYHNSDYGNNAAVLLLARSSLPFEVFQFKHFIPSEKELVITEADPRTRRVIEIDGEPAAVAYAELVGVSPAALTPAIFSENPLMLEIGDEWFVRSIQSANPDQSLTLFCAIEEGLPLSIGTGKNFVETLRNHAKWLEQRQDIALTLGCDCILRRLEVEQKGLQKEVEEVLDQLRFVGFSTFGEQFNSVHVNQTLTGISFGFGNRIRP
ncbi:MAG: FIST C-terminal domain-containing protein [Bdellovibrionales bacterium]|nr:FIST C-terminal domain-containing protein [Bdellovibrionales bacterium]